MIFPVFLKRGEVVFDGVQVGRIRREEEKCRAGFLNELDRFR